MIARRAFLLAVAAPLILPRRARVDCVTWRGKVWRISEPWTLVISTCVCGRILTAAEIAAC